jgi:hypothetical protein
MPKWGAQNTGSQIHDKFNRWAVGIYMTAVDIHGIVNNSGQTE